MKDFIEKPITAEVRELVLRIVERAIYYNNTQTQQSITSGKPTFFVYFSGHTAALYVNIHTNGWEPNGNSESFVIYLAENYYNGTADEIQNELVSVLKRMEEVYTTWYEKENPND